MFVGSVCLKLGDAHAAILRLPLVVLQVTGQISLMIWVRKCQYLGLSKNPGPLIPAIFPLLIDPSILSREIAVVEISRFGAKWIQKTYLVFHNSPHSPRAPPGASPCCSASGR
jgi:hypothetical protein